eukprot:2562730-Prorocentrum_lima.AAC.1
MLIIPPSATPFFHWTPHWNQHSPPSAPAGGRRAWPAVTLSWSMSAIIALLLYFRDLPPLPPR